MLGRDVELVLTYGLSVNDHGPQVFAWLVASNPADGVEAQVRRGIPIRVSEDLQAARVAGRERGAPRARIDAQALQVEDRQPQRPQVIEIPP